MRERRGAVALLSTAVAVTEATLRRASAMSIRVKQHDGAAAEPAFTHFVTTGTLSMSLHTLLALADARPVVTLEWLEQSVAAGVILDPRNYFVSDPRAEAKHAFSLRGSWEAARHRRLLEGRSCYIVKQLMNQSKDEAETTHLIATAALGTTGRLLASKEALDALLLDDTRPLDKPVLVVVGESREGERWARRLGPGCQVWKRSQFVKAVVQQSFAHQKPLLCT